MSKKRKHLFKRLWEQRHLQILVLPGILILGLFKFVPIYGLQLAFKNFSPALGVWESPWAEPLLSNFTTFIKSKDFMLVLGNTLILSVMRIVFTFPVPIIFALLLNELRSHRARAIMQGVSYLPHFISWVVCAGILLPLFGKDSGTLNNFLISINVIEEPIFFFGTPEYFRGFMVGFEIWKETGWSAILYMAVISSIDPGMYEAARIDGANRFQQAIHITLPSIIPTAIILLILKVGYILDAGFDQVMAFRNPILGDVTRIIDTYVYDTGAQQGRYSYATAVGFFKSVIGFILIYTTNYIANKKDMGIW